MEIFVTSYSSKSAFLCFLSPDLSARFLSLCWPAPDDLAFFATKFRGVVAGTFFLSCFASNNSKSLILYSKIMGNLSSELRFPDACFFGSSHTGPKADVLLRYNILLYLVYFIYHLCLRYLLIIKNGVEISPYPTMCIGFPT